MFWAPSIGQLASLSAERLCKLELSDMERATTWLGRKTLMYSTAASKSFPDLLEKFEFQS